LPHPIIVFTEITPADDVVFLFFGHYDFSQESSSHKFAMGKSTSAELQFLSNFFMAIDYFLWKEHHFHRLNKAINEEHQEREDNLHENRK